MSSNSREDRARNLIAGDHDAPPRRMPMFVLLVAALVAIIGISLTLVLTAPNPQAASAATQDDDTNEGTVAAHKYGVSADGTPTPMPLTGGHATSTEAAGGATGPTSTMTPAPGITPSCTVPSPTCETQAPARAAAANAAYGTAATKAVIAAANTNAGGITAWQATPVPQPQATVLDVADSGTVTTPATNALVNTNNALAQLGAKLSAEEAAMTSAGGAREADGAVPPIAATPAATSTPNNSGLLGTPILPPPPYAVPMNTCIEVQLVPNLDSSLAGPVFAKQVKTYLDPRNRQPVLPGSSTYVGHYVGLTGGATHLGIAWDWVEYPDLERRPLTTEIDTAATSGENGLPGRVNTHLWAQFRNTLVDTIVGASGQILASAAAHGSQTTIVASGDTPRTTVPAAAVVPTLYQSRATPFCLMLAVDYDAKYPYTGTPHQ